MNRATSAWKSMLRALLFLKNNAAAERNAGKLPRNSPFLGAVSQREQRDELIYGSADTKEHTMKATFFAAAIFAVTIAGCSSDNAAVAKAKAEAEAAKAAQAKAEAELAR